MAINLADSYKLIRWDIGNKLINISYFGKKDDSGRGLKVRIIQNSAIITPTTETLRVYCKKPDGTKVYINGVPDGDQYIVTLTNQVFTKDGPVEAELQLNIDGKWITSESFWINVSKNLVDSSILSSNDFNALQVALADVDEVKAKFATKADQSAVDKLNNDLTNRATKTEVEVERQRTNQILANPGSTSGDLALNDIKVGANGEIYGSPADAIRAIAKDLKLVQSRNRLDKTKIILNAYINTSGIQSTPSDGGTWQASPYIEIDNLNGIGLTKLSNLCFYDQNKNFISNIGSVGTKLLNYNISKATIPSNAKYIRFTIPESLSGLSLMVSQPILYTYEDYFTSYYSLPNNLKDAVVRTGNLYNKNMVTRGYFINYATGAVAVASSQDYGVTEPIPIIELTNYYVSSLRSYAFYNESMAYISGSGSPLVNVGESILNAPTNAKYFRMTIYGTDNIMIAKSSSKIEYQPFYYINEEFTNRNNTSKIVACIGDSITWGFNDATDEQVLKPFTTIIKEKYGYKDVINYGISGSTIGGDGVTVGGDSHIIGYQPMYSRIDGMTATADIVILFGGTNDFGSSRYVPLGVYGDSTINTFYGALELTTNKLIEKYLGKKIFICTPLHRIGETNSTSGLKLSDYVDAIVSVCKSKGIEVIDLYRNGGFYAMNNAFRTRYSTSGLHPNQGWYYILADKIGNHIISNS